MSNRIRPPDSAALAARATKIKRLLDIDGQMQRRRLEAGVELLAAQKLIPRGQWEKWCEENIDLNESTIKRIMKAAASNLPAPWHAQSSRDMIEEAKHMLGTLQDQDLIDILSYLLSEIEELRFDNERLSKIEMALSLSSEEPK